jgi:hypothetical protein
MRTGVTVYLSATDRKRLQAIVDDRNNPQKHVWRARIVLETADGLGTATIMRTLASARRPSGAGRSDSRRRVLMACYATRRGRRGSPD